MATSRYDPPATAATTAAAAKPQGSTTSSSGESTTTGNSSSQTNQSGSSSTNRQGTTRTNTQNMTGSSLAALESLISTLLGGGDQASANLRAQRLGEINTDQQIRAGYSRENAFNDAQGLMAQTMRQTLEKLLPSINRSALGAGTSQSSMRALLTQKAAQDAAEAASAQGLQAAVQYGGIASQFSSILERLTQPDNTNTQNLLNALQTARGAVTNSVTNTDEQTNTDSSQTSNTNSTSNQTTNTNQNQTTLPISGGRTSGGSSVDSLVQFGGDNSYRPTAGTTADFLAELAGDRQGQGWSSGFSF